MTAATSGRETLATAGASTCARARIATPEAGRGLADPQGFPPCQQAAETKSHLTTIRLSDREIYKFRPVLLRTGIQGGGCIATAGFRFEDGPVPGATLEILGS